MTVEAGSWCYVALLLPGRATPPWVACLCRKKTTYAYCIGERIVRERRSGGSEELVSSRSQANSQPRCHGRSRMTEQGQTWWGSDRERLKPGALDVLPALLPHKILQLSDPLCEILCDLVRLREALGNERLPNRCGCPSIRAVNRWNLLRVQLLGDPLKGHPLPEQRVDLLPPYVVTLVAKPMREPDVVGG
jgi:hypothetical protein